VAVFSGTLREDDTRTIRVLPVEVPAGTRQIIVDLVYAPRTVDDRTMGLALIERVRTREGMMESAEQMLDRFAPLRNLLNITAFDPGGTFRGRWDRNRPGQSSSAIIAEQGSSPGMVDGAIPDGIWQMCLEVHEILTPCRYTLRVECLDALLARATPPRSLVVQAPQRDWLAGDLHLHSDHSDGRQPVEAVARALAAAGLDFFALTDHNTTSGLRDLPDGGPVNLPGVELTTFWGHATCLGIRQFIPWYEGERMRRFRQIAGDVHGAGGLICVAHPVSPPQPLCAGCRWEYPGFEWTDADLLEIWNGDWDEHAPINVAAVQLWDRLLTSGLRIWGVAGSDMHDIEHLRHKRYARTHVHARGRSAGEVLRGLREGRIVLSSGPMVTLEVEAAGRRYGIGDTAVVPAGSDVVVRGSANGAPERAQVNLVVGGRRVRCGARWEQVVRVESPTWLRAEVVDGQTYLAMTNPVFVDLAAA